jgi:hypothetical protein
LFLRAQNKTDRNKAIVKSSIQEKCEERLQHNCSLQGTRIEKISKYRKALDEDEKFKQATFLAFCYTAENNNQRVDIGT